jgi:hypothetical protein
MMNNINTVSTALFTEFAKLGKYVSVHAEGNVLSIRVGNSDVKIMNWETVTIDSILESARGLTLKEEFKHRSILLG